MNFINSSIWHNVKQKEICPSLDHDLNVDILIVGGGITGLSIAYHLKDSNYSVCLVEKNEVGSGVTSKTTGKITYLQENVYSKINLYHNQDIAKQYFYSQLEAINIIKNIVEKEKIDCDLEKSASFIFTKKDANKILKEEALLKSFGASVFHTNSLPNGENILNSFYTTDAYVFHVLKYVYALKNICLENGIKVFENTSVYDISEDENRYICKTQNNKINAKYVVLALHYPYFLKPFWTPLKTKIEKSYLAAYDTKQNRKFNAITIDKPTYSFRYYSSQNNNYIIRLLNTHLTTTNFNEQENFNSLLKDGPIYAWSNSDLITYDALPFIGKIKNNLYIATGYNTWGMTNGSLAGKIISDLILKKKNDYEALFDPRRKINLGKIINFPIILGCNTYSFVKSKIITSPNIRYEKRCGKNVAIYTDENKKEHIVYNICPHLKCGLLFNDVEKTWDCPCHGSRFDIDGKCIQGPSNYNIAFKP